MRYPVRAERKFLKQEGFIGKQQLSTTCLKVSNLLESCPLDKGSSVLLLPIALVFSFFQLLIHIIQQRPNTFSTMLLQSLSELKLDLLKVEGQKLFNLSRH